MEATSVTFPQRITVLASRHLDNALTSWASLGKLLTLSFSVCIHTVGSGGANGKLQVKSLSGAWFKVKYAINGATVATMLLGGPPKWHPFIEARGTLREFFSHAGHHT